MREKVKEALPFGLYDELFVGENVPFYGTEGALGMSLILGSKGYLELDQVLSVAAGMIGKVLDGKLVDETYLFEILDNLTIPKESISLQAKLRESLISALRT